jgi:hypothetical protein
VRIAGSGPERAPWTTVGSSGDLLHATWLALADSLEFAVLTRAGVTAGHPELRPRVEGMPVAEDYLFITSANVSGGVTGRVEAAHYDLAGIQDDFGACEGIVLIGHRHEPFVRASYGRHLPMSPSILAFHKLERDQAGKPALVLERHGSLGAEDVAAVAARHGFGLVLAGGARERLPLRDDAPAGV